MSRGGGGGYWAGRLEQRIAAALRRARFHSQWGASDSMERNLALVRAGTASALARSAIAPALGAAAVPAAGAAAAAAAAAASAPWQGAAGARLGVRDGGALGQSWGTLRLAGFLPPTLLRLAAAAGEAHSPTAGAVDTLLGVGSPSISQSLRGAVIAAASPSSGCVFLVPSTLGQLPPGTHTYYEAQLQGPLPCVTPLTPTASDPHCLPLVLLGVSRPLTEDARLQGSRFPLTLQALGLLWSESEGGLCYGYVEGGTVHRMPGLPRPAQGDSIGISVAHAAMGSGVASQLAFYIVPAGAPAVTPDMRVHAAPVPASAASNKLRPCLAVQQARGAAVHARFEDGGPVAAAAPALGEGEAEPALRAPPTGVPWLRGFARQVQSK